MNSVKEITVYTENNNTIDYIVFLVLTMHTFE
jgi:hypothetical protein